MLTHDLLDVLEPIDGDDENCEAAFRVRQRLLASLGEQVVGELERITGFLRVMPVTFFTDRRFDIGVEGAETDLAIVIGGLGESEELVDAVAWPIDRPGAWATMGGGLPALGWPGLLAHPACDAASSLRVFRTPMAWLRACGTGIVPLDIVSATPAIHAALAAGGRIKPEDDAHATEIAAYMPRSTDFQGLVVDDAREAA